MSSDINNRLTAPAHSHPHCFGTVTKMRCHMNTAINMLVPLFYIATIKIARSGAV
jgi:hypothetical protein